MEIMIHGHFASSFHNQKLYTNHFLGNKCYLFLVFYLSLWAIPLPKAINLGDSVHIVRPGLDAGATYLRLEYYLLYDLGAEVYSEYKTSLWKKQLNNKKT